MLGLKLNHVSKRGHMYSFKQNFKILPKNANIGILKDLALICSKPSERSNGVKLQGSNWKNDFRNAKNVNITLWSFMHIFNELQYQWLNMSEIRTQRIFQPSLKIFEKRFLSYPMDKPDHIDRQLSDGLSDRQMHAMTIPLWPQGLMCKKYCSFLSKYCMYSFFTDVMVEINAVWCNKL